MFDESFLINKIKGILFIIINLSKLILTGKLFSRKKYNEIIEINKLWLKDNNTKNENFNKKGLDFFARRNIAIAYVYIEKSDEGFEYLREIINKIKSDSLIEKMMRYFIYPEFKNKNYDKIIYRCSYFNKEKLSKNLQTKINKIIFDVNGLIDGKLKMTEIIIEGKVFIQVEEK